MYNRIALISDLHLDNWARFYRHVSPVPTFQQMEIEIIKKCLQANVDLIVNAGDIHDNGVIAPKFVENGADRILYVPGNHDYYGQELPSSPLFYSSDQIAATTLWSNFEGDVGNEKWVYEGILDERRIKNTGAYKVQNLCNQSIGMLRAMNREIVVTHFPPSRQSTADIYRGNPYNSYFVNHFDRLIEEDLDTKLWMFGHVHHKHSYMIGGCLCVCNPLGNPHELYKDIADYKPTILVKDDDGQWKVELN